MSLLPALAPNPRLFLGRWLLQLDARPKIFLALLTGLVLWRLPEHALPLLTLAAALLCFSLGGFSREYRNLWKGGAVFVLTWTLLKLLLDILGTAAAGAAVAAAAGMGLRLAMLLMLGLTLVLSASPRSLGVGLAWFLRPVLGQRSWRLALALAMMIHFLPLTWTSAAGLLQNLSRRRPKCPWRERLRLVPQALLRVMSQTTWNQTVAVAARGLDRPEAWQPEAPVRPVEWVLVLIFGLGLAALSLMG